MKIKSILLMVAMLIALLCVTASYAEDTIVMDNYTFTMPEGYTLMENDTQVVMYNDNYVINMYQGPIINPSVAKEKRLKKGYTLLEEKNYTLDGATVNQQNYNTNGFNSGIYTFNKNDKTFIISLVVNETTTLPEGDDNPVTGIIKSLN